MCMCVYTQEACPETTRLCEVGVATAARSGPPLVCWVMNTGGVARALDWWAGLLLLIGRSGRGFVVAVVGVVLA